MTKTPFHLWIVGILSLVWNAGGGFDYVMTQTRNPDYLEMLTPEQLGFLESAPLWFEAAWAVGVWLSIAGSLLLLLRSRYAGSAFALSLLGLIVASIYTYVLSDGGNAMAMSGTGALIFTIAIPVILILLLIYARAMTRRGVLR
jgi:lipopolysaccharide export LptBFGC system permease protein LptF